MITGDEAARLREDLLRVLSEDAHNTERLLARLDAITRESGILLTDSTIAPIKRPFDSLYSKHSPGAD